MSQQDSFAFAHLWHPCTLYNSVPQSQRHQCSPPTLPSCIHYLRGSGHPFRILVFGLWLALYDWARNIMHHGALVDKTVSILVTLQDALMVGANCWLNKYSGRLHNRPPIIFSDCYRWIQAARAASKICGLHLSCVGPSPLALVVAGFLNPLTGHAFRILIFWTMARALSSCPQHHVPWSFSGYKGQHILFTPQHVLMVGANCMLCKYGGRLHSYIFIYMYR